MEFISKKQQAIINFIDKFSFEFQYPPSIREIAAAMGHQSISTTHGFIERLDKKKLLSWRRNQPRTIVLTRKGMDQVTKQVQKGEINEMAKQPKLKKSGLKPEDKVIMHSCYEARKEKYKDKVWTVKSEPWDLCGSEVVLLEGFNGGFATEYLKKVEG